MGINNSKSKESLTFSDLEFFQREYELHTISLAYVQSHYDIKDMSLDEFCSKCHDAYNYLNSKKDD